MNLLRKFGSVSVAAMALAFALAAVIWGSSGSGVDHTIQNAREIEASFRLASAFVENFKRGNGRLPNEEEFAAWADAQPNKVHSAKDMHLVTAQEQIPRELVEKFGGYAFDLAKFRREVSYHMWSSKLWGIFLFAGFFSLLAMGASGLPVTVAIYLGILADLEGLAISIVLREWQNDVPTFVHALRLRASQRGPSVL